MTKRPHLAAAAIVGVVALLLAGAPAHADKPEPAGDPFGMAGESAALMRAQVPIDDLIAKISAESGQGLGGLRSDPARNALEVYWHGSVPATVSATIVAARAKGLTVTVTPARYSLDELLAETKRLADLNMTDGKAAVQLAMVGPKYDGSGIQAGVAGVDRTLSNASFAARARQALPGLNSAIPLEITASDRPQLTTRFADTAPFWGGALMTRTAGNNHWYCSTGFGVTGNNGAATYMLTANHCTNGTWTTGNSLPIGTTVPAAIDRPHDSQLLLGGSSGRSIYTGDYFNGANQSSALVRGAVPSATGGTVCTSGAFSGTRCGITVISTNLTINVTGYGQMTHMTVADHPSASAGGNGDSGGPVYSVTPGGVLARGTLSAMDLGVEVPCTGYPTTPGFRRCSQRIFFPDINRQLAGTGTHLNVG